MLKSILKMRLDMISLSRASRINKIHNLNFELKKSAANYSTFIDSQLSLYGISLSGEELNEFRKEVMTYMSNYSNSAILSNLLYIAGIKESLNDIIERYVSEVFQEYFSASPDPKVAIDQISNILRYQVDSMLWRSSEPSDLSDREMVDYLRSNTDPGFWNYLAANIPGLRIDSLESSYFYQRYPVTMDTLLLPYKDIICDKSISAVYLSNDVKLNKLIKYYYADVNAGDIPMRDGDVLILKNINELNPFQLSSRIFDRLNQELDVYRKDYLLKISDIMKVATENISKKFYENNILKFENAYKKENLISFKEVFDSFNDYLDHAKPELEDIIPQPQYDLHLAEIFRFNEAYKAGVIASGESSVQLSDYVNSFSKFIFGRIDADKKYVFNKIKSALGFDLQIYYNNSFELSDISSEILNNIISTLKKSFQDRIFSFATVSNEVSEKISEDGTLEEIYNKLSTGNGNDFVDVDVKKYITDDQFRNIFISRNIRNNFAGRESKRRVVQSHIDRFIRQVLSDTKYLDYFFVDANPKNKNEVAVEKTKEQKEEQVKSFFETLKNFLFDQINKEEAFISGRPFSGTLLMNNFSSSGANINLESLKVRVYASDIFNSNTHSDIPDDLDEVTDPAALQILDDDNISEQSRDPLNLSNFRDKLLNIIKEKIKIDIENKLNNSSNFIKPFDSSIPAVLSFIENSHEYFNLFPGEKSSLFSVGMKNMGTLYNILSDTLSLYNNSFEDIRNIISKNNSQDYFIENPRKELGETDYIKLSDALIISNSDGTGFETNMEIYNVIGSLHMGSPLEVFRKKIVESKDRSIKHKSKSDLISKLSKIMQTFHSYGGSSVLLNSNYLLKSDDNRVDMAIKSVLRVKALGGPQKILEVLKDILEKNRRLIIPNDSYEEKYEYLVDILNRFNKFDANALKDSSMQTSKEFDDFVGSVLSKPNFLRFFQSATQIISNYHIVREYIELTDPKDESVFSANMVTDDYRFRVLGDLDPYHFQVGGDTDCCQIIGGAGEQAAIDSFINPTAGVVVLESNQGGTWRLVSQSYFHVFNLEDGKKGLILDNIEAGSLGENVMKNVPSAYAVLAKYLEGKGFSLVGCGKAYTLIISDSHFASTSLPNDPRSFKTESRYTDFSPKSFYNLLKPKFTFNMPKINAIEKFDLSKESSQIISIVKSSSLKRSNHYHVKLDKLLNAMELLGMRKEASRVRSLSSLDNHLIKLSKALDSLGMRKEACAIIKLADKKGTLGELIEVGADIEDPDFYFQRQGSLESIGKVLKKLDKKTDSWWGVKVKDSAKDKLDSNYLYYVLMQIGSSGYWKGLATGTTNLQHIRKGDLLSIPIG